MTSFLAWLFDAMDAFGAWVDVERSVAMRGK
jgi:hypothetical protein